LVGCKQVKAGTNVLYQPYVVHRLKCYWGEDALAFDPDRFLSLVLYQYATFSNFHRKGGVTNEPKILEVMNFFPFTEDQEDA